MSSDHSDDPSVVAEYEEEEQLKPNPGQHGKWISGLVALIGLWMIAAPFVFEMLSGGFEILQAHFWSDIIVGLALFVFGAYNYYRRRAERIASVGVAALVALLGLWLMATPFVFGVGLDAAGPQSLVDGDLMLWNDLLLGLVVLILGAYSAYEARGTERARPAEA